MINGAPTLPHRVLAFYGDDFTGASATMEVLAEAGLDTVLFLHPPSAKDLAKFPNTRVMGVAGLSRSRSPDWMSANLPKAFQSLSNFGAPLTHYKTCSTFDSSPSLGSIGRAAEIGIPMLGGEWHPLVVGAPAIGRYQAFGNLFATLHSTTHRLDRHPVVSQHPATPMDESDVRLHLQRQTNLPIGLVDLVDLGANGGDGAIRRNVAQGAKIMAFDVVDEATLIETGRLVWNAGNGPVFTLGSQGVEYALIAYWRSAGFLTDPEPLPPAQEVDQLLVVSGSCSSVTAGQIETAEQAGFVVLDVEVTEAVDASRWRTEVERLTMEALDLLSTGRDVIVASSRTQKAHPHPNAPELVNAELSEASNDRIGRGLGELVDTARRELNLQRVVIAGGDTSGHAVTRLGASALSIHSPLAPGVPLCRLHADDPAIDGLEVALKGGQMGGARFFEQAKGMSGTVELSSS